MESIIGRAPINKKWNIGEPLEDDALKQKTWEYLGLTRIYTKRKGSPPDLEERKCWIYLFVMGKEYIMLLIGWVKY